VGLVGFFLIRSGKQVAQEAVLRNYEEIVKRSAGEIETLIHTPRKLLVAMSAAVTTSRDPWGLETTLVELQLSAPEGFRHLALFDMDGRLQVTGDMNYTAMDSVFSYNSFLLLDRIRANPHEEFFQSEVYFLKGEIPAMTMAVPIRKLGQIIGALAAQVSLRGMWDVVDGLRIGRTGRAYIVSPSGLVIANQDKKPVFRQESWSYLEPVKQVLNGETGRLNHADPETGDRYLSAFVPLSFGWGIVVEQQEVEAYETIVIMERRAYMVMVIIMTLALLVGVYAARYTAKPVLQLVEGTERISRRELDYHIELNRNDEIGRLARAFNVMARSLKESYDRLEQEVDRKTADLKQALEKVERLSALKSRFLSEVSHELRTPLAIFQAYGDTLIRLRGRMTDEEYLDCARNIREESARLARMINNLLDLSWIETGKHTLEKVALNLTEIADESLRAFDSYIVSKNLSVVFDPTKAVPPVLADRDAMRRVFDNLLGNAIKYTHEGGRISINLSSDHDRVTVEIADTGIGIDEEDIKRIFDEFYRAKSPGTRTTGTGLGLAIVRTLISEHGGHISVRSVYGEGSVFTFYLPVLSLKGVGHESEETVVDHR
jgi:signal transduction histidine kinase